jgi:hypothetical protein
MAGWGACTVTRDAGAGLTREWKVFVKGKLGLGAFERQGHLGERPPMPAHYIERRDSRNSTLRRAGQASCSGVRNEAFVAFIAGDTS